MSGQGLGVSSSMTSYFNNFQSNPLTGGISQLSTLMPSSISGLPAFMTQSGPQISAITTQASSIIGPGVAGIKQFSTIMNQSAGFGSAAAEWGAALKELQGKSFSDLGVNVSGFTSMASNGLSNVFGGLPPLPSLSNLIPSPSAVTAMAMSAKDNLASLGKSLGGLGTMFDAKDPSKIGDPASLIKSLQAQGLGDVGGINAMIASSGFDPNNLDNIPPEQLKQILANVQGSDLQKIVSQTGLKVPSSSSLGNLSDVLDIRKVLPASVVATIPGGSFSGLGNALGNLGGNFTDFSKLGDTFSKMEIPSLPNMSNLTKPIPDDVAGAFKGMLGTGDSPLGLPTMGDMLGSVTGKAHMDSFKDISKSMTSINSSPVGQALTSSANTLSSATSAATAAGTALGLTGSDLTAYVAADPAVVSAQAAVTTATTNFNSAVANNADLKAVVDNANNALGSTTAQLAKEKANLSLAGINPSAVAIPPGVTGLLGMASKLHSFGVDKQQLGFSDMFENMATNDLYGDAIKSSLLEGRNIFRQTKLNISVPTTADPAKTLAATMPTVNLDSVTWDSTSATETKDSLQKLTSMNNQITAWIDANPTASQADKDKMISQRDTILSKTEQLKTDISKLG